MKRLFAAAIACAVSACAHVDTGQIDYRVADEPNLKEAARASCGGQRGNCALAPAKVERRYLSRDGEAATPFKEKDVYSIELEQAVIGRQLSENFFGLGIDNTAEIAVLANVFEFSGEKAGAAQRRFLEMVSGQSPAPGGEDEKTSDVELKLIYFSDDVQRNQPFNFSNIPLMQRSEYKGGSIGIQIVVMEVDASDGPMSSMLGTLARFGQQSLPVSSEVSDVIFDLGESLLSGGSSDDRIFEYRFVLSSADQAQGSLPQAVFAPGRYVLRRSQSRDQPMDWSDVRLDHNTGRLFRLTSKPRLPGDLRRNGAAPPERGTPTGPGQQTEQADQYTELRDEMYLTLHIKKYGDDVRPEFYEPPSWSQFRDILEQAAINRLGGTVLADRVEEVLQTRRSEQVRAELLSEWSRARRHLAEVERLAFSNIDNDSLKQCAPELRRRRDIAIRNVQDTLRRFRASYQVAITAPTPAAGAAVGQPAPEAPLKEVDEEALVSVVARYFMPWATGVADKFANAQQFRTNFVNADGLATLAIDTATAKAGTLASCPAVGG